VELGVDGVFTRFGVKIAVSPNFYVVVGLVTCEVVGVSVGGLR